MSQYPQHGQPVGANANPTGGKAPNGCPDDIKKQLAENNKSKGCWYNCTHRKKWFCGIPLRTGIYIIAAVQLVICILTIVGIVRDSNEGRQKQRVAIGTAIVTGSLSLLLFFGAKYKSRMIMLVALLVAILNILLSLASLVVLFAYRDTEDKTDQNGNPIPERNDNGTIVRDDDGNIVYEQQNKPLATFTVVMEFVALAASFFVLFLSLSYRNLIKDDKKKLPK